MLQLNTSRIYSELRNSEEEAIPLLVESSHHKTRAGSGKIPPQLPPTPYGKSINSPLLVGPSTRVPLDLMPAKQSLFRRNPAHVTSFSISLIKLP
ncbi:hypothetical protein CDAR_91441 [Caerostris darwini]|uniref:Uncharacterized protein n=1 Tax=Caerostris darwini TaxID=1538125 RepID=A0AAV4WEK3_9ARAC|nr:hypothetical protein CDAR_91441 [Caerostris darwini]